MVRNRNYGPNTKILEVFATVSQLQLWLHQTHFAAIPHPEFKTVVLLTHKHAFIELPDVELT